MTDKREELKTNFDLKRSKYLPILKSKYEEIAQEDKTDYQYARRL